MVKQWRARHVSRSFRSARKKNNGGFHVHPDCWREMQRSFTGLAHTRDRYVPSVGFCKKLPRGGFLRFSVADRKPANSFVSARHCLKGNRDSRPCGKDKRRDQVTGPAIVSGPAC